MNRLLIIGFFILVFTSVRAQYVIFDERSTDNLMDVLDHMIIIERSLKKGELSEQITWVKDKEIQEAEFKALAGKFKQALPDSLFNFPKSGVPIVDTDKLADKSEFVRWTYANIDDNDRISVYLQLIVYFKAGKDLNSREVSLIEVRKPNETFPIDNKKLIASYLKRMESDRNDPPPMPPDRK